MLVSFALLFSFINCLVAQRISNSSDDIPFDISESDLGVARSSPSKEELLRILREAGRAKEADLVKAEAELMKKRDEITRCVKWPARNLKFRSFVVMDCELKRYFFFFSFSFVLFCGLAPACTYFSCCFVVVPAFFPFFQFVF
jgi:hypothetical protein